MEAAHILVCQNCKNQYYEPHADMKRGYCGHCCVIRQCAQDGTKESADYAREFARAQRLKAIQQRPRVSEMNTNE